jgi:hypothetical protein
MIVSASQLKRHDTIIIDDIIYEVITRSILKHEKHGFRKIAFTLRSDAGIRIYVCRCVDQISLVEFPIIKEPDCN